MTCCEHCSLAGFPPKMVIATQTWNSIDQLSAQFPAVCMWITTSDNADGRTATLVSNSVSEPARSSSSKPSFVH